MKKVLLIVFSVMVVLGITACSATKEKEEKEEKPEKVIEQTKLEEDGEQTPEKEPENVDIQNDTEKIYFMDQQTGEMTYEEAEIKNTNEFSVWEKLQEKGIVPVDSKVKSLKKEGELLVLDLDVRFGDFFRQQGTLGENEILKCIINTYLDAFEAEQIKITEEGYDLASSHKIYDGYMTRMEQ